MRRLLLLTIGLSLSVNPAAYAARDCDVTIDPFREIVIVDPAVLEDSRANPGGPWHFSSLLKQMLPAGATDADLSGFIVRWLNGSKAATAINGHELKFPGYALGERTICSWLRETGNASSDCASDRVDPSRVPYRLIAIVNRLDLDGHNVDHAEGRFVFAALSGPTSNPVSDPAVRQEPETVIFEYTLPLKSPADLTEWAKAWHSLGAASAGCTSHDTCEPYRKALETITAKFSSRGLVAGKPNGNSIGQIRTSHLAFGSGFLWQFRQFELTGDGLSASLTSAPVSQTPHHALDNTSEVTALFTQHAQEILKEQLILPRPWLGAEAILDENKERQWSLDGVDENVRSSLSKQTCNGCHGENRTADGFFHISPTASGRERVSDFLKDELPKRAAAMKRLLCVKR